MKKTPADIIMLHMYIKNYDQMMYSSWDMMHGRCIILGCFLPFYSPNSLKNQNFKNMKKMSGDIIILHMCNKIYDRIMYGFWDMVCDRCNFYFSFSAVFCPFTHLTAQKIKILKKWKKYQEITSFYISVPKIMTRWYTDPEICCTTDSRTDRQMDGQTDGRKKWHTEAGFSK